VSPTSLPDVIPVFPLTGAILLPSCTLPLNIFEPRYLKMVRDAADSHNIIGMIQPVTPGDKAKKPDIYKIGGAGRIADMNETDDGQVLINLEGLCRFHVTSELMVTTPYRQVNADWGAYLGDLLNSPMGEDIDRQAIMHALQGFLDRRNLEAELDAFDDAPDEALINSLAMILPLPGPEKQALLEAGSLMARADILMALMQMDGHDGSESLN